MQSSQPPNAPQPSALAPLASRVLLAVGIAVLLVGLLGLVGYALHIFFIAFAAVLFGLFLSTPAAWIEQSTRLSYGWALALVVLVLVILAVVFGSLIGLTLWQQVEELGEALPTSMGEVRDMLRGTSWGRWLLDNAPAAIEPEIGGELQGSENGGEGGGAAALASQAPGVDTILTGVTNVAHSVISVIVAAIVVLFAGFYFAAEPQLYRQGIVRLFPPARRGRAQEVLDELRQTLRWWIVGQLASMTAVGLIWGTGLWMLGVKLALVLGLLAFLAELIPYLGPFLATVPAFLLAMTQPEVNVLHVLFLYLALQILESYVFQPLFQERAVRLPPALTILAIMLLSYLGGILGALLAAPLTISAITLVRSLYVHDALEGRP
jgi:predicted PurR-regulated permease PerM